MKPSVAISDSRRSQSVAISGRNRQQSIAIRGNQRHSYRQSVAIRGTSWQSVRASDAPMQHPIALRAQPRKCHCWIAHVRRARYGATRPCPCAASLKIRRDTDLGGARVHLGHRRRRRAPQHAVDHERRAAVTVEHAREPLMREAISMPSERPSARHQRHQKP